MLWNFVKTCEINIVVYSFVIIVALGSVYVRTQYHPASKAVKSLSISMKSILDYL